MNFQQFSKKDLQEILYIIQSTVACKTEDDIATTASRIKDLLCADRGVIALGDKDGNVIKLINVNYPIEWLTRYKAEQLYLKDPIIKFNTTFHKTALWTEALDVYNEEPFTDLMKMSSDYKLNYGLASGIAHDTGTVFSFSAPDNRFTTYHRDILDIVTPHIHQALLRICKLQQKEAIAFSEREEEVLKWMKEGKTDWEISVILGIQECTVKFHVQNIREKLGAVSKAHAIALAMELDNEGAGLSST